MSPRYPAKKSGLWWGKGRGLGSSHKTDQGETTFMFIRTKTLSWAVTAAVVVGIVTVAAARAEDTVKIGLILPMTGGQASTGKQIDNAIKLYMQQQGDTVAGKKVEIILK